MSSVQGTGGPLLLQACSLPSHKRYSFSCFISLKKNCLDGAAAKICPIWVFSLKRKTHSQQKLPNGELSVISPRLAFAPRSRPPSRSAKKWQPGRGPFAAPRAQALARRLAPAAAAARRGPANGIGLQGKPLASRARLGHLGMENAKLCILVTQPSHVMETLKRVIKRPGKKPPCCARRKMYFFLFSSKLSLSLGYRELCEPLLRFLYSSFSPVYAKDNALFF